MIRSKTPFYKIYFYLVFMLCAGDLIAAKDSFLFKEHKPTKKKVLSDTKVISSFNKKYLPPPVTPSEKEIQILNTCENDTTEFFAVTSEGVDNVSYNFGDGVTINSTNLFLLCLPLLKFQCHYYIF